MLVLLWKRQLDFARVANSQIQQTEHTPGVLCVRSVMLQKTASTISNYVRRLTDGAPPGNHIDS